MKNMFKTLLVAGLLAFGTVANAVTVAPPISIDFGTGVGVGGTITWDGTDAVGTNISINAVNIANATDSNADGGYTAVALLNFDTAAGTITVDGTMGVDASTGLTVSQTLFNGVIDTWSYDAGFISLFSARGGGGISTDLSTFVGEALNQAYTFGELTLNIGDSIHSADLLLAGPDRGLNPPEVPVPAAAWLFGSGLLGLMGVARRKA